MKSEIIIDVYRGKDKKTRHTIVWFVLVWLCMTTMIADVITTIITIIKVAMMATRITQGITLDLNIAQPITCIDMLSSQHH